MTYNNKLMICNYLVTNYDTLLMSYNSND